MGSAIGGIAGSLVSGLIGKDAAEDASDAQIQAAMIAAEQFKPYSVYSPLGSAVVNEDGKTIKTALSSQAQGLLDLYAGEGGQSLDAATQERLGIMDQLAARGEEDARRFTTERLFSAGNLGTHAGTRQIGEVERSIADARLSRMLESRNMAFNERQTAFGNALSLYQLPNTLGGLVRNNNPAAVSAAQGIIGGSAISSGYNMAAQQQLGSQIGSAIGGVDWGNIFGGSSAFSFGNSAPAAMPGFSSQFF